MEVKKCSKCGVEKPTTIEFFEKNNSSTGLSARCKQCASEYLKKYREANKEKLSKNSKQHYQENKETIKKKTMIYREQNKEKIKVRQKKSYLDNIEQRRLVLKKYREENKETLKEMFKKHYQNNKEKKKLQVKLYFQTESGRETSKRTKQKRRSIEKGLEATLSRLQWKECKEHFNNKCAYCGEIKRLEQDHFHASNKNGEYSKNNIIPACRNCNASKSAQDFFVWFPKQEFYTKQREQKIIRYLNYDSKNKTQQLALL